MDGSHAYAVFGIRLVASAPLPGLPPASAGPLPDVVVRLQAPWHEGRAAAWSPAPLYCSADHDQDGRPSMIVDALRGGGAFRIRYADGIHFVLDASGRRIWATWPEPWTVDDAAMYLLGPVLAFALRLGGTTCLHASAVAVEDRAIAFVGPPGAGKSTLAAAFARRRHPVIADDVLALGDAAGGPWAHPGPARVRLWPETVDALYGAADALPRLTPSWDKRFVDLTAHGYHFQDRALPIGAVYLLDAGAAEAGGPRIEGLAATAAVVGLVANTHANHLLDARMRADEFRCIGRLAGAVPVRRLVRGDDLHRLRRLCDLVVEDALELAAARV